MLTKYGFLIYGKGKSRNILETSVYLMRLIESQESQFVDQ